MFSLNDMRTVTNLYSRQKDVLSFNQRLATMAFLLISFAACEGLGRHARSKHVACLCAHDGEAGYATGMMNLHDQKVPLRMAYREAIFHEFHEDFPHPSWQHNMG